MNTLKGYGKRRKNVYRLGGENDIIPLNFRIVNRRLRKIV